jgi:hypothetical protein
VGQDQCQRLVQALGQRLDAEFRTQLLAHLGDGILPALVGRATVSSGLRCGGGLSAKELGNEGGEWLADRWGVWETCH